MYDLLLKLGLTVVFLFIFVLILALIFRNRKTAHCGLCGEQKKIGCFRGDCPRKVGKKEHNLVETFFNPSLPSFLKKRQKSRDFDRESHISSIFM
ncbi:MAG: hypothetical protein ACE5IR_26215 [bacterium]